MPTSSVRPIAPIAADIANRPVCSQKPSAYWGSHTRNTTRPMATTRLTSRRRPSDTRDLPRAEQPRRPPQEPQQQHDVGHDLRQPPAEEGDLVLVAGRERRRDPDDEPPDDRAGRRVEAAENSGRDGGQREQPGRVVHARGREAREERAA